MDTPKVSATKNSGLQDDHDPSDAGQRAGNKSRQQSQKEGPAAYAPREDEAPRAFPDRDPAKKKTGEF